CHAHRDRGGRADRAIPDAEVLLPPDLRRAAELARQVRAQHAGAGQPRRLGDRQPRSNSGRSDRLVGGRTAPDHRLQSARKKEEAHMRPWRWIVALLALLFGRRKAGEKTEESGPIVEQGTPERRAENVVLVLLGIATLF